MDYCEERKLGDPENFVPSGIRSFFWFSGSPCDSRGNAKPDLMWSLSSCCLASGFISGIKLYGYLRYRRQESYIEMYTIDTEVMLSVNLERLHYLATEA